MPVEVVEGPCRGSFEASSASTTGRLSSFGFSGTIAHGLFASAAIFDASRRVADVVGGVSLYRSRHSSSRAVYPMHISLTDAVGDSLALTQSPGSDADRTFEVTLSSAVLALLSDHVVGGKVLFPGVSYVDMALSAGSIEAPFEQLADVAFVQPCVIPPQHDRFVMRYNRGSDDGKFDIASVMVSSSAGRSLVIHAVGTLVDNSTWSMLRKETKGDGSVLAMSNLPSSEPRL